AKTIAAMQEAWGNRRAVLARELTKRYEEFVRGTFDELLEWLDSGEVRGEFCVIVEGYTGAVETEEAVDWWQQMSVVGHVDHYCEQGLSKK
ncbi:rRNA (cytidine-2'-O-)-methyltransferase, partial [Microbacterium sp. ZXX196]|nr:rRNA (cytidine-2'-O-)-methyltransferase [Microbacterium sp. ZXX196]